MTPLTSQATLTVTGPTSLTYGTTGTATATGGSGTGAVTFSAGASTGCSVSGTTVSVTNASGTCSLTATKAADGTYQAATSAPFTVTLNKASQAPLTVAGPSSLTYGTAGTVTSAGGSGTGAVSFSVGASTGCSVSGTTVSVTDASGTCAVTATKAADNNYLVATSAPLTITLSKANQAPLTVTGPTSVTYGTTGTATSAGGSGTGAVSFSATGTGCAVTGTTVSVSNGSGTCFLTATKAGDNNYNNGVTSPSFTVSLVPPPFGTPVLIRAVGSPTDTFVIGRVDGATSIPGITLQVYSADACTNGALVAPTQVSTSISASTDAFGYFGAAGNGVPAGKFVAVKVISPALTAMSTCLASSGDNDSWPKAQDISPSATASASALHFSSGDFIDEPGKTRWFKFKVVPGQRIQVTLSGLPADYDLAVFKDILQLFTSTLIPTGTADLTKVTAEYAPSAFTPSAFTPSAFTPSAFTPSAFTPSAFTPSAFTPSAFTPSAFTPSAFTASAFSPSAFTPSAFTPSAFTPSAFTPSAFTPSAFTPSAFTGGFTLDEITKAFSSAQTRSILGASATLGLGNESVVVNTWSNTGYFYVRVASHGGAFSTASKFTVTVDQGETSCAGVTDTTITPAASRTVSGGQYTTVILTDSSSVRQNAGTTAPAGQALVNKLTAFAGRPGHQGRRGGRRVRYARATAEGAGPGAG